jgi:hypothetical protein
MDSSQIFEPAFRSVPKPSGPAKPQGMSPPTPSGEVPGAVGRMVLTLLERLDICRSPRIVSAQCLVGETQDRTASAVAGIMGDAGILTDLAV